MPSAALADQWRTLTRAATIVAVLTSPALFIWFRASFPRYRYDQIMRLGWKIFIPLTLVWLVVIAVWMQTPWNIWST